MGKYNYFARELDDM